MDLDILKKFNIKENIWIDVVFYIILAISAIIIFCYAIFSIKISLLQKQVGIEDAKIALYGTQDQKAQEKRVFDYKKKIDDLTGIINGHKISSNVFNFIEDNTLPNVWFSNFNMSESINTINLLGEVDSMETLSKQVNLFENQKDYIKNISVLNSAADALGKTSFILNLDLDPKIFTYTRSAPVVPASLPVTPPKSP